MHECVDDVKLDCSVVALLMQVFEGMLSMLESISEALIEETIRLREATCLLDLQVLFDLCVCAHTRV